MTSGLATGGIFGGANSCQDTCTESKTNDGLSGTPRPTNTVVIFSGVTSGPFPGRLRGVRAPVGGGEGGVWPRRPLPPRPSPNRNTGGSRAQGRPTSRAHKGHATGHRLRYTGRNRPRWTPHSPPPPHCGNALHVRHSRKSAGTRVGGGKRNERKRARDLRAAARFFASHCQRECDEEEHPSPRGRLKGCRRMYRCGADCGAGARGSSPRQARTAAKSDGATRALLFEGGSGARHEPSHGCVKPRGSPGRPGVQGLRGPAPARNPAAQSLDRK